MLIVCTFTGLRLRSVPTYAQQNDSDEVVRVDTRLTVVPIRVRDKRGTTVAGLTQNDLTLKDEDNVVSGLYLYPGADRVSLVFALDQSGSVREVINEQRSAALALFEHFGEKSQVAVLRFAEQPTIAAEFGRNVNETRAAFSGATAHNQHTAIFDAAAAATKMFETLPRVRSERRLVVLISDGLDNASSAKPATVIASALKNQVTFYVIHVPLFTPSEGRLKVRAPSKGFRQLAEKTGGKYFLVGQSPLVSPASINLSRVFEALEQDLRSQYLLGFYAKEAANEGDEHRVIIGMPAAFEYQVNGQKYSRTHEFLTKTEAANH